jgi:hypothetical protein
MVEDAIKFERPGSDENPVIYTPGGSPEEFFQNLESQF